MYCSHVPRLLYFVKGYDVLDGPGHVRDDEANARVEFARMRFALGNDTARFRPTFRLIGEACIATPHFIGGAFHRARQ